MSTKNNNDPICRSYNNTALLKKSLEKDDVSSPLSKNKSSLKNYTINSLTLDLSKSESKLSTSKILSDEELNDCEGEFVAISNENTCISSTFRNENRRSNHRNISIN